MWDEAEVRKIISAAHWTLDRLGLVKVAKSMRSLVICFGVCIDHLLRHTGIYQYTYIHTCNNILMCALFTGSLRGDVTAAESS